jgi:hypothetical protein
MAGSDIELRAGGRFALFFGEAFRGITGMITVSDSIRINKAPEKVFPVAADPMEQLKWDAGTLTEVTKLNAGPLAVHAKYRGRFKGIGSVEYEFVEYKPSERFVHFARIPMGKLRHIFQLKPAPEGTELIQTIIVDPNLLGIILKPIMRGTLKKRIKVINREIRDHLRK